MIVAYVPLLVAILGLLLYALSAQPKVAECGRLMFACGVLVTLMAEMSRAVHL